MYVVRWMLDSSGEDADGNTSQLESIDALAALEEQRAQQRAAGQVT